MRKQAKTWKIVRAHVPLGLCFLDREKKEVVDDGDAGPHVVPIGTLLEEITGQRTDAGEEHCASLWWNAWLYLWDLKQAISDVPEERVSELRRFPRRPSERYRAIQVAADAEWRKRAGPIISPFASGKIVGGRPLRVLSRALHETHRQVEREGGWIRDLHYRFDRYREPLSQHVVDEWRRAKILSGRGVPLWIYKLDDLFAAALLEMWWLIEHDVTARCCLDCRAWFVPWGRARGRSQYCGIHRNNAAARVKRYRATHPRMTGGKQARKGGTDVA